MKTIVHYVEHYDPPAYYVLCNKKKVVPDFNKTDKQPLDELYISTNDIKYSPRAEFVTCPQCLRLLREEEDRWYD